MKKMVLIFAILLTSVFCLTSCNIGSSEEPHAHDYGNMYYSDAVSHWKECACGESVNIKEHSYGNWITITEATETSLGLKNKFVVHVNMKI